MNNYYLLSVVLMLIITASTNFAFADTFDYCSGKSFNSNFWQKSVCLDSVSCFVSDPVVTPFDPDYFAFDYYVQLSQSSGYCTNHDKLISIIEPKSYDIKIIDADFDSIVFHQTITSFSDLDDVVLFKDILYEIKIDVNWNALVDDVSYVPFIEDDYGNLVDIESFNYVLDFTDSLLIPFEAD